MNIFSAVETKIENAWSAIKGNPLIQNLESEFEGAFKKIVGAIPWDSLKSKVTELATSGLTTAEAHNALLALAASFVPGGNAALASMVAAGAVNTVAGLLQSIPVPAPAQLQLPSAPPAPLAPPATTPPVSAPVTGVGSSGTVIATGSSPTPPTPPVQ